MQLILIVHTMHYAIVLLQIKISAIWQLNGIITVRVIGWSDILDQIIQNII